MLLRISFVVCLVFLFLILPQSIWGLDTDRDGLLDQDEIRYRTDIDNADTDGDGYRDRKEIISGYDPRDPYPKKLQKRIEVSLSKQRLRYYLGDMLLGKTTVSTGKASTPTPVGEFAIANKAPRAWSKRASLWMPYWMGFSGGKYGIHELPEWPGGRKEGQNHLGTPVSGGCIRLGVKEAKKLYDWTPIGTRLIIKK